jgi:hypothetical protein
MSFPPGTEMFQFPGFASATYGFSDRSSLRRGLPHSEILGSKPARGSPRLIAACHVLHRLSTPRHPPDALLTLTPPQREKQSRGRRSEVRDQNRSMTLDRRHLSAHQPGQNKHTHAGHRHPLPKKRGKGRRHPCQSAGRQGTSPGRPVAHHHHTMSRVKERLPPLRQPTGSSTRSGCPKLHPSPHPSSCLPRRGGSSGRAWWARADLNGRPHAYQACALTS